MRASKDASGGCACGALVIALAAAALNGCASEPPRLTPAELNALESRWQTSSRDVAPAPRSANSTVSGLPRRDPWRRVDEVSLAMLAPSHARRGPVEPGDADADGLDAISIQEREALSLDPLESPPVIQDFKHALTPPHRREWFAPAQLTLSSWRDDDIKSATQAQDDVAADDQATVDAGAATPGIPYTMPAANESLFSLDYLKLVGTDIKETFTAPVHWDRTDWTVLAGVAAGIGVTYAFDNDIRRAVQRNRNSTVDSVFDAVEPFGAEYSFGVLGGFYLGGVIFHDPRATSVGLDGLAASLIASGLIAQPLKFGLGRARPDQGHGSHDFQPFGGNDSLPSGHATQAFAVATVVADHYDDIWLKIGSYGLASMVGFARVKNDAHWASDVLTGAAIGTFVGELVVRVNEQHRTVSVTPIVSPSMVGVMVNWSF